MKTKSFNSVMGVLSFFLIEYLKHDSGDIKLYPLNYDKIGVSVHSHFSAQITALESPIGYILFTSLFRLGNHSFYNY